MNNNSQLPTPPPPPASPLIVVHLVTQRDQSYGSRMCCEMCGGSAVLKLKNHIRTAMVDLYETPPDGYIQCNKMPRKEI